MPSSYSSFPVPLSLHTGLIAVASLLLLVVPWTPAQAQAPKDRVAKLAHTLTTSKAAKARLSAAVALGELRDKRSLRPLIRSLKDKNKAVRAVAATSLGHLGDEKALPALKRATRDKQKSVRRSALEAIARIRRVGSKPISRRRSKKRRASYRISARERPLLREKKPEVFVVLKSTADDSKGKVKKRVRAKREARMKTVMTSTLRGAPAVTINPKLASELELPPYYIDLSILDFKRRVAGPYVEIECSLRVAVSNQRGKMLSVMTGGAKVQVPKRTFRRRYESQMRLEALENAVHGIHYDVVSYLQKNPS